MSSKQEFLYLKVFEKIKEIFDLALSVIISDFKKAILNYTCVHFPDASRFTYFFHFDPSIWRRINENGQSTL